jgi:hypothetical protein
MPTNLPPEYFEAEERYRAAYDPEEQIERLEELISTIPKHKGTDKLRADLRRKLSKMKSGLGSRAKTSRFESPYHIDREGAGQAVLVGPANTGKSSLVGALTNAKPEVAEYPFSTWGPTPGMVEIDHVQVQLIDTPPLDREFVEPDMLDLARRADLLLLVVDLQAYPIEQVTWTLDFLAEHKILVANEAEFAQEGGIRLPVLLVVNKVDGSAEVADHEVFGQLLERPVPSVAVSAKTGYGLNDLRQAIYRALEIMRVYSQPPGKQADRTAPFVLPIGATVEAFAARVHQDFARKLKGARVWGSGEFDGQLVSRDHVLEEGDVVELRI